jgi:hypothetical protein
MCYCFYATIKGQVPEAKGGKWSDHISDAMDILGKKVTRSEAHYLPPSIIDKMPETPPQRKKRKLGLMASDVSVQQPTSAVPPDTCSLSANHCQSLSSCSSSANQCQSLPTYWDSTEEKILFNPVLSEKNALEAVNNQIKLLMDTQESPKGYVDIVSSTRMEGEEIDEDMSEHQRWIVQQKNSTYLGSYTS